MKFMAVSAVFDCDMAIAAEEMITGLFYACGVRGVICDVPIPPPDDGFESAPVRPQDPCRITGFLPADDAGNAQLSRIRAGIADIAATGIDSHIETGWVDETDWEHAWKDFFHVTRISDRIVVRPQWRAYTPLDGEIVIRLDPGMAFGTGTHPTTAMCLELIDQRLAAGASFLDIGTGSGILMIAAAKLGAVGLTGLDTDATAVAVARDNLALNQVPDDRYHLMQTTVDGLPSGQTFDVIAANIIAPVIVEILPHIRQRLKPGGTAILSGIVAEQEHWIGQALDDCGFKSVHPRAVDEWLAFAAS